VKPRKASGKGARSKARTAAGARARAASKGARGLGSGAPAGAAAAVRPGGRYAGKVRPLRDRVLVRRVEEQEQRSGGIIIPDTAREKPQQAEVVAVGSGRVLEDGTTVPLTVKAGDRVLVGKWSGTDVKIDDQVYLILTEDELLGVLDCVDAARRAAPRNQGRGRATRSLSGFAQEADPDRGRGRIQWLRTLSIAKKRGQRSCAA
jgi:chaperonin GroES